MNPGDLAVTRAWVLHPEITTDRDRREAAPALQEAAALAAALPDLTVAAYQECFSISPLIRGSSS